MGIFLLAGHWHFIGADIDGGRDVVRAAVALCECACVCVHARVCVCVCMCMCTRQLKCMCNANSSSMEAPRMPLSIPAGMLYHEVCVCVCVPRMCAK